MEQRSALGATTIPPPRSAVTCFGRHGNALGFMRLVFASLVIVAHVPEIAPGGRAAITRSTASGRARRRS